MWTETNARPSERSHVEVLYYDSVTKPRDRRGLQSQKARSLPMGFQGLGYPLLEPGMSGLLAQLASQAVQTSSCFSCFVRAHRAADVDLGTRFMQKRCKQSASSMKQPKVEFGR